MFFGAVSAMYLMKEVFPLCQVIQRSGGWSAGAFWVVVTAEGASQALEVGALS